VNVHPLFATSLIPFQGRFYFLVGLFLPRQLCPSLGPPSRCLPPLFFFEVSAKSFSAAFSFRTELSLVIFFLPIFFPVLNSYFGRPRRISVFPPLVPRSFFPPPTLNQPTTSGRFFFLLSFFPFREFRRLNLLLQLFPSVLVCFCQNARCPPCRRTPPFSFGCFLDGFSLGCPFDLDTSFTPFTLAFAPCQDFFPPPATSFPHTLRPKYPILLSAYPLLLSGKPMCEHPFFPLSHHSVVRPPFHVAFQVSAVSPSHRPLFLPQ